jgi:SAM-dependent methyltransferase
MKFIHPGDSHQHSLETLNQLYEYDDFMLSITSLVDLGCGTGEDLQWWANATTRDDTPMPLNIKCTGVDLDLKPLINQHPNIAYQQRDFEGLIEHPESGFDILWCHDAFQNAHAPIQTLSRWWDIASPGAMLYICVPITQRIHHRQLDYYLPSGSYYHYSLVNLIYMLATAGWDCGAGFFKQASMDPWIHAVVYKSEHAPLDPKKTSWHTLTELNLLPDSAAGSIQAHNYLRQQDLILPWLDHSLMSMSIK